MSELPLSDPQIQLGRRLAATEKKTREKALKLVESFVSKSTSLTELDLMKLWKALYYCIWMQDRPIIQHELAQRLARMIHIISEDRAVLFLRAFWQTMLREWNGIDKHRLDKFYALMRYFLNESFAMIKNNHWSKESTRTVMQVLQEFPLNPSLTVLKAGVQFHVLDVLVEELEKIEPHFVTKLAHDVLSEIFEPVFYLMAHADDKASLKRISNTVIDNLIFALESAAAESEELQAKTGESGQFLGDRLVAHASAEETRGGNRTNLWDTRKAVMKAVNRPTKRKRDDADDTADEPQQAGNQPNGASNNTKSNKKQKQKEVEIPSSESAEESWQSGESVDSNDAAALDAIVNGGRSSGSGDQDEDSEDDDDYNVENDDDKGQWDDHVIHSDDDEDDENEDSDNDEDDDEPIFLPPSAKHRKLLVSVHVMKALQRLGTGGAENEDDDDDDDMDTDMHYFMNDDAKRDEEDEEDDSADSTESDEVPPPFGDAPAPEEKTPATPPVVKKPTTSPGSGRRVQFDMARVHVQEFDKHESPATVQSPRPRNGPARPILKQSPGQSPSTVAAKHNDKSKMKSVQRKL